MVGTPSYMPPEQAMGGEVTPRSDLYSLGAMLYEMVTGRPPFVGDNNVAIIGQHINTPPVAPTWHNPSCPKSLEALILRLLAKDASARPESASDVLTALESIETEAPVRTSDSGAAAAPSGPDPVYGHTFVGREAEVHQLRTAFDGAMSGEGALMMVVGEPGIGKTTLCQQLQTYVTLRGGTTLIGHCYEEGSFSLPYLGFVEAMRGYVLDRDTETLRKELGSGASEVARIVSEVRERLEVDPRPSLDAEDDRYRLLQAVSSFLRNASTVQPLLIVLEDLHDADSGTLDMLTHVARNLGGSRLLVVGTYRDVEVDRTHPLSPALADLRRVSSFGRIGLRGLTADEVQRMMTGIAGREMPWSLSEAVFRQTEGNPLFVQEVLRDLVEEGNLSGDGAQSISDIATSIPEGLRDVIGKRLSRLSDECNGVLRMAAVIGREFRLDVLEKVAGLSEEELLSALEEAQRLGVIEERTGARVGTSFRFAHAFFRQTLYDETFAPRRIRLHQQVGRALEEVYAGRLEDHADELTEHFAQSTELEDLEKALRYGEMSAERAMAVYAYTEAVRLLEQALQVQEVLDPDDKAKRCDLLLALADALGPAGNPLLVMEQVAPEAFKLAEALNDGARASRASLRALESFQRYGTGSLMNTPEFAEWAKRADRYVVPETKGRVIADYMLSGIEMFSGRMEEVHRTTERAMATARRLDDPETLFTIAFPMINRAWAPQHMRETYALAQEFAARPREGVSPQTLALALLACAHVHLQWGAGEQADLLFQDVQDLVNRIRDPAMILWIRRYEIIVRTLNGELEQSLVESETLVATGEEVGSPVAGRQAAAGTSFRPRLHLGQAEKALKLIEGEGWLVGRLLGAKASCLAVLGRIEEAEETLQKAIQDYGIGPDEDETASATLELLAEAAILVEDRASVEMLAARIAPLADLSVSVVGLNPARLLGGAAALLGRPDNARSYYLKALETAGKIRHRPELALTHLELAELLLEHYPDERVEALEHLDAAITELRDMKMQPALERALSHRDILKA